MIFLAKVKSPRGIEIEFIPLSSELDLGRLACNFSSDPKNLFAMEYDGNRVFAFGEIVGSTRLAYYIESADDRGYAVYSAKNENDTETFRITQAIAEEPKPNSYRFPIIKLEKKSLLEKGVKQNDIIYVKAQDYKSLLNGVINNSLNGESMGMVYSFESNGIRYVGSFDIITDDAKVFVYAELEDTAMHSFFAYDYSNGSLRKTERFSENSYIYVRIINLAVPLPYFKA